MAPAPDPETTGTRTGSPARIVAVLGMHRSGTSALAGTLAELGVDLGDVSRENRFQPKGNNESRKIMRLHDRILRRNGASWWQPPAKPPEIRPRQRERLRAILDEYEGEVIGVKDPRMLLLMDLWRDLPLAPIGTFRNPVDVARSLQARARELGEPLELLDDRRCHALWARYNELLLAEHERRPFPLLDFDRPEGFAAGAASALRSYGFEPRSEPRYFEPDLTANRSPGWRSEVEPRVAELYDRLAARAAAATRQ